MAHSCLSAWIRIHALSDWCDACLLVRERPLQEQLFYRGQFAFILSLGLAFAVFDGYGSVYWTC